jgi:uncharacterized membrane protein
MRTRHINTRHAALVSSIFVAAALAIGLAGCSVSVTASVPKSQIAHTASLALQKEVGSAVAPKIDCGSGDTTLSVGEKLNCVLTDPTSNKVYKTVVTITKITGKHYSIDAQVAKTPNN